MEGHVRVCSLQIVVLDPFAGTVEMEAWFNHRLNICNSVRRAPEFVPLICFTKFVITHQDISPRTLILDQKNISGWLTGHILVHILLALRVQH